MQSLLLLIAAAFAAPDANENLLVNGNFESGTAGWSSAWSRDGSVKASLDGTEKRGAGRSMRIEHTGEQDWSLNSATRLPASPGDLFEFGGWVRLEGVGAAELCLLIYDAAGKAIDWSFGDTYARSGAGWQELRTRVVLPPKTAAIQFRFIGHGPCTAWCDDLTLQRKGTLDDLRAKNLPEAVTARSESVEVAFRTADGTFTIRDLNSGRVWNQRVDQATVVLDAKAEGPAVRFRLLDPASMLQVSGELAIDPRRPEVAVSLSAEGELRGRLSYPHPFATQAGQWIVMPMNEGIGYPVDDASIKPIQLILYGGHGLCMAWYGVVDGPKGLMTLVDTPDDASVRMERSEGLLALSPIWDPQKGRFGYARKLRYVLIDDGGYVAMCKRYRQHAKDVGLFKTLAEKRKENPNVDLLIGAVNVWTWERDAVGMVRELKDAGIDRILWSAAASPVAIAEMNKLGVLTSRYDIYQDVMDPAQFPKLRHLHSDWTTAAWPDDLMIDSAGRWIRGWEVESKEGKRIPCGVTCDRQAVDYAQKRIPEDLKTHPYRCRFIDTTTASPWRECYDPKHPVTRSESREWKMRLLEYVSRDCKQVCGCETGHDASVPYLHYYEGMLSLGPYRVPDSGRNTSQILDDVPERVAKFQTGHFYRLPLWELVYHDCVVAQWYWGDYNNKLPKLWDRRDLFNALYGTPPMFMFRRNLWKQNRDRFVKSYRTIEPVARATGYSEMLSHEWLTKDHAVQQTKFANGVIVTANFGEAQFTMPDGRKIEPLGLLVEGLPK